MDACLTQMLEVAYEWRAEADYLVGSEELVSAFGNDYDAVLSHLAGDPSMTPATLAATLVDDYAACYGGFGEDTTYSAISLGPAFSALVSAFNNFAAALKNTGGLHQYEVWQAWAETTWFNYYDNLYEQKDLYDFAA